MENTSRPKPNRKLVRMKLVDELKSLDGKPTIVFSDQRKNPFYAKIEAQHTLDEKPFKLKPEVRVKKLNLKPEVREK